MSDVLTGRCLCGAVQYSVEGAFEYTMSCHCSQCARWTGGVFSATEASREKLQIKGEDSLKWYQSSPEARRGFCGTCGSSLFWEQPGSGNIDILLGTVNPPTNLEIGYHLHVDDKSDYYRICDGKPRYRQDSSGPMFGESSE